MFLVRSAFWLTVAFVAFHPKDVDLGKVASTASDQALAAGQQIVIGELIKRNCLTLHCDTDSAPPLAVAASQAPPAARPAAAPGEGAPFPLPRPAWLT